MIFLRGVEMKKWGCFAATLILSAFVFTGCHHPYAQVAEAHPEAWTPTEVENMLGGNDPYEGFNRAMFSCTDFLMTYGADPLGRVYTTVFPRPFIHHFNNVCVNLEYPARAVSLLLQARWGAAGTESLRFLANTTLGILIMKFDSLEQMLHMMDHSDEWIQVVLK